MAAIIGCLVLGATGLTALAADVDPVPTNKIREVYGHWIDGSVGKETTPNFDVNSELTKSFFTPQFVALLQKNAKCWEGCASVIAAASTEGAAPGPGTTGEQNLVPLSTFRDCETCPQMTVLPPGQYLMGASREDERVADEYSIASERPQHPVNIAYKFAIGTYEVSVAEFAAYVSETGAKTGGECLIRAPDQGPQALKVIGRVKQTPEMAYGAITVLDADFRTPGAQVTEKHPATCVSRREAVGYFDWLSKKTGRHYRLPTEAEWEYAARAANAKPFYYGGGPRELCKYGNFADRKSPYSTNVMAQCTEDPSPIGTAPVGSYAPNAWGLYDMIGNAFEVLEDCSSDDYKGAPADGSPWRKEGCEAFAQRSYDFSAIATNLRSAARCLIGDWDSRANAQGLRAAVSLDSKAWDRSPN